MVFKDRVSKYPGRWTMVKSDGTSEVITLVRNDEPVEEGTPINADTLNTLSTVAGAIDAAEQAKKSEENSKSIFDGISRILSGNIVARKLITLNPDDFETSSGDYKYLYKCEFDECKENHVPVAIVLKDSEQNAYFSGFSGTCESSDGYVAFWCKNALEKKIEVQLYLIGNEQASDTSVLEKAILGKAILG